MTTKLIYNISSRGFITLSAISLVYVAALALWNPQAVMDLVGVKLVNNDAISSIRGVYGGVGFTIFFTLVYLAIYQVEKGLGFLTIFWGFYSISRLITLLVDGSLGSFGTTWLWTETMFCIIGLSLFLFGRKLKQA
jgi:hypothetical protein